MLEAGKDSTANLFYFPNPFGARNARGKKIQRFQGFFAKLGLGFAQKPEGPKRATGSGRVQRRTYFRSLTLLAAGVLGLKITGIFGKLGLRFARKLEGSSQATGSKSIQLKTYFRSLTLRGLKTLEKKLILAGWESSRN